MHNPYNSRGSDILAASASYPQRKDGHLQHSTTLFASASRNLSTLISHLKLACGWEEWLLTVLKRRVETLRCLAKEDRAIRNLATPAVDKSSVQDVLFDALSTFQDDAAERANSYISLETFIRLNLIQPLEKDIKARSERLKRRQKSIQELLSKLENSEKIYTRAVADLETVQRKYTYLKQRQALDLSEEIEKIEIELRKCTSALSVKDAECDVARTRMVDIQQKWKSEWEAFQNVAGTVDLERRAQIRKVSMELLQAEMLVQDAVSARHQALYIRLQDADLLGVDTADDKSSIQTVVKEDIASSLWPRTQVTQQQLATLNAPVPVKKLDTRSASIEAARVPLAVDNLYGINSRQSFDRPSAPRTYSEDSFSTPRTESPIVQILTADEMDQVSPRFPSLDSMVSLIDVKAPAPNILIIPKTFKKPCKPSKPLPGLPSDEANHETVEEDVGVGDAGVAAAAITLPTAKPPSLPSFSNLRLGSLGWEDSEDLIQDT